MRKGFFLLSLFLLVVSSPRVFAYSGSDDPEAQKAARDAVERLGPGRGSLVIQRESIKIIGIDSSSRGGGIGYSGDISDLNRDLTDLGATRVGTEVVVTLSGDVLFDFDKTDIKKEAEATLKKLAKGIKELGWKHITIEGHTDSKGSDEYNMKLSLARARAVKSWFVQNAGMSDFQYEIKGYGETKPVAPNQNPDGSDNPEGRAKNRRVEIRVKK